MSFMLDLLGSLLTNGIGAADLDHVGNGSCGGASQVMIFINPNKISDAEHRDEIIEKAIAHLKSAAPAENSRGAMVPGEDFVQARQKHEKDGIVVNDSLWEEIRRL